MLPADKEKLDLYKIIESKNRLGVGYRMRQCDSISVPQATDFSWRLSVKSSPEKPRWIIVGFQTGNKSDQKTNAAIFDNLDLRNINVYLNSRRYPEVDYDLTFDKNSFSRIFGEASDFRSKFYRMDELISNCNITPIDFKNIYPLFVIDVSKQSERLKNSTTDIQVKATFNTIVPANTNAYAMVISDKIISFQSDGKKLSVIQS